MAVSIYCPFCKRHTALSVARIEVKDHYNRVENIVGAVYEQERGSSWWMGVCNNCHEVVLVHNNGDTVYPTPLPSPTDERVPEKIRRDLDEAKLCYSVEALRGCVTMARRAIQSACLDKEADEKKTLEKQIEELAANGLITKDLKEWAHVVRWVGNDGAHPGGEEVEQEDAEDTLKLAEEFLYALYVTPAIAKERRQKRGK